MRRNEFALVAQKIESQGNLRRAWSLSGGISAEMDALEIDLPGGEARRVIVRRPGEAALRHNPRAAEEEFQVLRAVREAGLSAPAPVLLDTSGEIFAQPYLVIDYIAGTPEFSPVKIADFPEQAAAELARIHRVDWNQFALGFLRKEPGTFAETFRGEPYSTDESLGEGRIRTALAKAWPIHASNTLSLLHGDYWPGNWLWQEGKLAAVIDWEDAALGDPLQDLAIARLELCWIMGCESMERFTRGYFEANPVDLTALPYWDLFAALRLLRLAGSHLKEWCAFFAPYGRGDITEETLHRDFQYFVDRAFKKIDIL